MGTGRLSAVVWGATVAVIAAAGVLLVLGPGRELPDDFFGGISGAAFLTGSLAYATVGAVLLRRLPGHRIGRLFACIGVLYAANGLAYAYAEHAIYASGLPFGLVAAKLWGALEVTAPVLALPLLLLPDGRLPSPRWRPALALVGAAFVLFPVSRLLMPGTLENPFAGVQNTWGIGTRELFLTLDQVGWACTVAAIVLGVAAVATRLRRSRGEERQQLKWVLTVVTGVGVVVVLDMATWYVWPEGHLQGRMAIIGVAFATIPVAAGIAILRYRLYDIDIVINRALVVGALTVLLGVTYAALTLLLGTALGSGSALATAVATLAVAVAFRPLRARLQDAVDRRLGRARYDALRRVAAFLEDVRAGRVAPEDVEAVLRETVGDPALELRLLLPGSERLVDVRGADAAPVPDGRVRTPIEGAGTRIGHVLHAPQERPDVVPRIVEAAGLAIEIVRLRAALRRQLDEVAASRRRIVAAGDEERRRIERDLHDGAQQRLVAIGLALRHAQHELGTEDAPGYATLEATMDDIAVAIRELRELAGGLRPSQLDGGLGPAFADLATRAPVPVAVDATNERFPAGVEAAAYFIACEGLTNATKHACASAVSLSARRRNGSLVVCVADDGVGGAVAGAGTGLRGLADRVGAHGGRLRIESEHGAGTRLVAELPCGS
jgi:signal transduction histidine kinase